MNVLGQVILAEIKKQSGFENAVIAGGFVRDHILGGEFKDVDIFVPCKKKDFRKLIPKESVEVEKAHLNQKGDSWVWEIERVVLPEGNYNLPGFTDIVFSNEGYGTDGYYLGRYDMKYKNVDVQVMGYDLPEEDFGRRLVEEFDFHINRAFYDGYSTIETPEFKNDVRYLEATLAKIGHPRNILKAINKFNRLKEKYPMLAFNTTLDIKETGTER